jgi:carbon-monoxide dehydrogenase small subunit
VIRQLHLTVNGKAVARSVEPRTHLADFLREKLRLTGTHLRCEQGVCGACTVLIDGRPARSCITYAALCNGAAVDTIEGLENDAITARLRRAFSLEHGLQCGFCTPGMLVTARDIVMRIPDADEARIRLELSGNLCRCTGYAGIVRAVQRVLAEELERERVVEAERELPLAPVGSRPSQEKGSTAPAISTPRPLPRPDETVSALTTFGLGSKKPNIEIRQSFQVDRPPAEVWRFFADIEGVAACLPGARLNGPPVDNHVRGQFTVKLGPIAASFSGEARIERNDENYSGVILGGGQDARASSRATGEIEYRLSALAAGAATKVDLEIRALIAGPLAQFGRGGIVEDLTKRIVDVFSRNIEAGLSGHGDRVVSDTSLQAGSLLKDLVKARLLALLEPILRMFRSRE